MFNTTIMFVILGILVVVSIILSIVALTKKGGSLTGPQGPAGKDGVCRNAAGTSCTGPQGIQGIKGPQGIQGIQGIKGPRGPAGKNGVCKNAAGKSCTGPQGPKGDPGTCDTADCKAAVLVADEANNKAIMNSQLFLPSCRGFSKSLCGNKSSMPVGTSHVDWLHWDGKIDKAVTPTSPDLDNCFDTFARQNDAGKFCSEQVQEDCGTVLDPDDKSRHLCVWNATAKTDSTSKITRPKGCSPVCMPGNLWVPNPKPPNGPQPLSPDQQLKYLKGSPPLPSWDNQTNPAYCCIGRGS